MALFTPMLNSLPRRMLTKERNCCSLQSVFDHPNLAAECHHAPSIQELIDHLSIHRRRTLCVHYGLSLDIRALDRIRILSSVQEIPHEGIFCDLT
ncbi:hypothetical protein F5J12DRAFT_149115 [Pisolithus orientalis]|uniref:uncharacterized protein n=1 Tax=Pisolithus orientalis TaxID=936130 RepID=UPI002224F86D|nr:uncharacterized protein F5J12DRAFT_579941 [Pisolithus orientalis]XP_051599282.1 uncharacterized protein F5J12DRAFT_149115 [Pisolithus orientalis]KAI5986049.1 hypothetical protein F5J12DRAFT_579941 [Pisolithus orientalis]KAI6004537.1 hypothetical protein F5J12DRAFT_149115 [Pisolithus orientalis]